jgi:uncharacterized RDD family membrane protein YckC
VTVDGGRCKPRRALTRFIGLILAALPLCLGFVRILFDDRRRGFQDRLAGTVVIEAPGLSVAEVRRDAIRAAPPPRTAPSTPAAPPAGDPPRPVIPSG